MVSKLKEIAAFLAVVVITGSLTLPSHAVEVKGGRWGGYDNIYEWKAAFNKIRQDRSYTREEIREFFKRGVPKGCVGIDYLIGPYGCPDDPPELKKLMGIQ